MKNPQRDLPRVLISSVVIVTTAFVGVNSAIYIVLPMSVVRGAFTPVMVRYSPGYLSKHFSHIQLGIWSETLRVYWIHDRLNSRCVISYGHHERQRLCYGHSMCRGESSRL